MNLGRIFDSGDSAKAGNRLDEGQVRIRRVENSKYPYYSLTDSVPVLYPLDGAKTPVLRGVRAGNRTGEMPLRSLWGLWVDLHPGTIQEHDTKVKLGRCRASALVRFNLAS